MTYEELERVFRRGDSGNNALRLRLIAARRAVGMEQKEIADAIGVPKQTYHSQEARGAPSVAAGRYFYKAHGIDFNYLYFGDFQSLDAEVRDRLAAQLGALE
mgnify:CR=1 FL=1